jgi:hypothetical protein
MNSRIMAWALRNRVGINALEELREIFGLNGSHRLPIAPGLTEAYTQSLVRLEASHKGLRLWRNNVGALLDSRGVPVRYGLGNDSPTLNKIIKSGDLIGWRPLVITPALVGAKVAQFVSRECKRPGWSYRGDAHEEAQLKWAEVVNEAGGDAAFTTGEGSL